ncbi:UPAR/Ly6 domain-containing protein cold-like [Babylonia areolata]|uniref:UPAR/Ly6 domain-containing protein cold-like n=1 Tax=Babylonia areolata TaxID=304850 RepID=UPI003FD5D69E
MEINTMSVQLQILVFLGVISCGFGLECYVCDGQFDNKDKCIKSSVQCTQSQDTCLTHIRWKAPEFWTPRSEKIHIIGKQCATLSECNHYKRSVGLDCMRDWYRNWECYECCQGDRCNYYVTLGASSVASSITLLLGALACVWLLGR